MSLTHADFWQGNEAVIHLPGSIFDSLECSTPICSKGTSYQLQFVMYENSALFPLTRRVAETRHIASMIVSSRIGASCRPTSVHSLVFLTEWFPACLLDFQWEAKYPT